MDELVTNKDKTIYSPASIIRIFDNAINVNIEKKIITISGIYKKTGEKSYDGDYYDQLKDEGGRYSLTVITHQLKREKIEDDKLVKFTGYISRGLTKEGHIRINVHLENLLEQSISIFTEEDLKRLQIQKQKSETGFKDVDSLIKKKIFNSQVINIGIITTETKRTAEYDINASLGAAVQYFSLHYKKTNLTSITAIITEIDNLNNDKLVDLIVISRGGEELSYFENTNLCQATFSVIKPIISAIGHKTQNLTLFEKISDKSFITPTAFGNYLKEMTESYVNDLKNSTAKIIEDTKAMVVKQYEERFKTLQELNTKQKEQAELDKKNYNELLINIDKNHKETLQQQKDTILDLRNNLKKLEKAKGRGIKIVVWIILGIIIGILLSLVFYAKI